MDVYVGCMLGSVCVGGWGGGWGALFDCAELHVHGVGGCEPGMRLPVPRPGAWTGCAQQ